MQQVDVQGVAVDPFPAVQQPAQRHQFGIQRHPAGVFDRVASAHLVGHRADSTDPGGSGSRTGSRHSVAESRFSATRERTRYGAGTIAGAGKA